MKKDEVTWAQWIMYSLIIIFILFANVAFSQIEVKHFNAKWNDANDVDWFMGLEECKVKEYIEITERDEAQKKYKIAVVPTIIIFKDVEVVGRFQADLSFKMVATREEVQEEIDNQLMSDF